MSAALATTDAGLRTLLVDERPTLGGQIFKQPGPGFTVTDPYALGAQWRFGRALIDRARRAGRQALRTSSVDLEPDRRGMDGDPGHRRRDPRGQRRAGDHRARAPRTGRWCSPAGPCQASSPPAACRRWPRPSASCPGGGWCSPDRGRWRSPFPAQLADFGADIARRAGGRSGAAARGRGPNRPDRLGQHRPAARRRALPEPPAAPPSAAAVRPDRGAEPRASGRVERVVHAAVDADWRVLPGTEETVDADLLCLGYGFVPSPELLRLVGCAFDDDEALGGPVVRRDVWCRTSVPGIYAAGDGTGVEGSFVAIDEGTTAGLAAALDAGALPPPGRVASGAGPSPAGQAPRAGRGDLTDVPGGPGHLRTGRGRHRGLSLRGDHLRRPWRPRSAMPETSAWSRRSPAPEWARARGARASGTSRR